MKLFKKLGKTVLFLCLAAACLFGISRLVLPKRYEYGANWDAFAKEDRNSMDVVFFGSSMVYCNVIPAILWEQTGLNVYDMAGPAQTSADTYYYVEEMFRTQSPSTILVEVSNIHYDAENGQSSIVINLDYLPPDLTRLRATFTIAPEADRATLLFPPYAYHGRWSSLTADDWRIAFTGGDRDPLAGYTFISEANPQPGIKQRSFEQTEEEYVENLRWFLKIQSLCQAHNCRCIFYVTASCACFPQDYLERMQKDLTSTGAEFFNSMEDFDEIGLDFETDFYGVIHFNCYGAEKNSVYLGRKLTELGVTPRKPYSDEVLWRARLDHYAELKKG